MDFVFNPQNWILYKVINTTKYLIGKAIVYEFMDRQIVNFTIASKIDTHIYMY